MFIRDLLRKFVIFFIVVLCVSAQAEAVRIGVISQNAKHMDVIDSFLKSNYAPGGKNVVYVDFSIFDSNGLLDLKAIEGKFETFAKSVNLLYLDFNQPMRMDLQSLANTIQDSVRGQTLIVANTGLSSNVNTTLQIRGTLFGKVNGLILIGEMDQRERLIPGSYFGPEMLTAIKPPRQWEWPGSAALLFLSHLGSQWYSKSAIDWKIHFAKAKSATKRLWLGLDELF